MATRKGPWTEEEDMQLVCFVGFFGDRRWDFIARVSGLNRTGKSCRLRWVNYLHPGLRHGRITPKEERLILELHSRWGNRWSRIARKLPGRTDNEVKNYWRTHMRKKAQEEKKQKRKQEEAAASVLSPSSPSSSWSSSSFPSYANSSSACEPRTASDVDAEESRPRDQLDSTASNAGIAEIQDDGGALRGCFLDQMWECDIACDLSCPPAMASPVWEYCSCSLWKMDDEELGFSGIIELIKDHYRAVKSSHICN